MRKNSILVFTVIIALMFSISVSCSKPDSSSKIKITVNSWVGFGPLYVAVANSIFEKNGLNVEIIKLENAPDRRAALISQRVDIVGSTLDDLAVTIAQGVDAIAFACADFSNGGDGIIAARGIDSLDKLKKVPIAVQPGFVNHFFLLYVLERNGIPTSDLIINPMTPDDAGAAFLAGAIDAAVTWEPFLSEGLKKRQGAVLLASSKDYPEAILDIFIARRSWFQENQDVINGFQKSWDDALDFIQENPNEAYRIIGTETGIDPNEVGVMLTGAKLLKNCECTEFLSEKLTSLAMSINRLWKEAGYISEDINLIDSIFLPKNID